MWEMFTMEWLRAALTRAVRTTAQTALAVIGTATALGDVDWHHAAATALLSGILSLLTSLAGLPECR